MVKRDVDNFAADTQQFDDITMLCVRLEQVQQGETIETQPDMASIAKVAAFVEEQAEKLELPMKTVSKLMIAVDEIYSNIVRYSGAKTAQLRWLAEDGMLLLCFTDDGIPYNPLNAREPDVTATAEEREIGGLGLFMVKKMMDKIEYEYTEGKNRLTLGLSIR